MFWPPVALYKSDRYQRRLGDNRTTTFFNFNVEMIGACLGFSLTASFICICLPPYSAAVRTSWRPATYWIALLITLESLTSTTSGSATIALDKAHFLVSPVQQRIHFDQARRTIRSKRYVGNDTKVFRALRRERWGGRTPCGRSI